MERSELEKKYQHLLRQIQSAIAPLNRVRQELSDELLAIKRRGFVWVSIKDIAKIVGMSEKDFLCKYPNVPYRFNGRELATGLKTLPRSLQRRYLAANPPEVSK